MTKNIIQPTTLVELLCQRAQSQPDKWAYTFLVDGEHEGVNLSYAQLDQQARIIAAKLQSLSAPGERALLLYPPGLDYIAAFFGCLYASVVAVPTYSPRRNRPDPRFQTIALDAQATVVLTTTEILSDQDSRLTKIPELRNLHWLATNDLASETADIWQMPDIQGDTLAFLQYTSGSTDTPKGVMVSYKNLVHNLEYIKCGAELGPFDTGVFWLPAYHDMGLINGIINPVYTGMLNIMMAPATFLQRPIRWLQAISRYKATYSGGPNFAYELCVNKIKTEECENLDLSRWRCAFNGAEPIQKKTLNHFTDRFKPYGFRHEYFYPCYGLAEVTVAASGAFIADESIVFEANEVQLKNHNAVKSSKGASNVKHLIGSGHAWPGMEIIIVDPKTSTKCLPDKIGEIWIRGASVAQGYWNNPEATKKSFQAYLADTGEGPFLRTEDMGFIKDGELFVTGRMKELIIIRGKNHYPQDIESTVERSHPALRPNCGAAFSIQVENEERLVVVQEVSPEYVKNLNRQKVIETIRKAVAEEYQLQVYAVVLIRPRTIPKTSSGKNQRRLCAEKFLTNHLDVIARSIANVDEEKKKTDKGNIILKKLLEIKDPTARLPLVELYLLEQISEISGISTTEIDTKELIIALGIDSLIAVGFVNTVEEELGVNLQVEELLENATIANLAQEINEQLSVNNSDKMEKDS